MNNYLQVFGIRTFIKHHYIIRGDFMIEILWDLFMKTGDIKYYNLLQKIKKM